MGNGHEARVLELDTACPECGDCFQATASMHPPIGAPLRGLPRDIFRACEVAAGGAKASCTKGETKSDPRPESGKSAEPSSDRAGAGPAAGAIRRTAPLARPFRVGLTTVRRRQEASPVRGEAAPVRQNALAPASDTTARAARCTAPLAFCPFAIPGGENIQSCAIIAGYPTRPFELPNPRCEPFAPNFVSICS